VHHRLELGAAATRTSALADTAVKRGSTGEMLFVTVRQEFHQHERLHLVEKQDIRLPLRGGHRSGCGVRRYRPGAR
jgi:3-methylfumaryl-CoA hydratase